MRKKNQKNEEWKFSPADFLEGGVLVFALTVGLVLMADLASAAPKEHKFKSPSFSGINQSSHYLTIENQETSRKQAIKQEIKDLKEQLERDAENTTLAKFIRNVESRIYSTLSRQIVDGMFGENPSNTGSFNIEGTGISYVTDGDTVILTITDENGNVTTITIPLGDFGI
jgi:hypothetical protein